MALARSRRGDNGMNYWPGFVDALSTLILSIIFILTVFVVVQFFLQQELTGKDTALTRLNAQIAQLTDLLSMEKTGKADIEAQLAQLRASLSHGREPSATGFKGVAEGAGTGLSAAQGQVSELETALEGEKKISARALAQVEILNQQIAALPPPARRASSRRSMPPRARTRNRRAASPISASASTSRWRRR